MQLDDNHGALEEDSFPPNNENSMILLPEERIVSEEEEFVEIEDGEHDDEDHVPEVAMEERVVAVAPFDEVEIEAVGNTRPRRSNSGIGVERIRMYFSRKVHSTRQ